ncbi:MAG: [citrate (pro-3S)-lyase] ligase [Clostridia bacterium]|nr:[citrate (pro-3S)-lyase] ligase [Clostridia bacterium]
MNFELYAAAAVDPLRLQQYNELLLASGLRNEGDTDYTVLAYRGERLLACGSLKGNVLKQIAVGKEAEGEGVCASVVSALITEAFMRGSSHLFLFTKPQHQNLFSSLSFYPIIKTDSVLMMENQRHGLSNFLKQVPRFEGSNGCVVCHCNPMTNGHLHLIRYAAQNCEHLYVFVVSEDRALFPYKDRLKLVCSCTQDIENITVMGSGAYIISEATFPTYFIKDTADITKVWAELDILLFTQKIAPALGITKRFVGEEPYCAVTRQYNARMKELLPKSSLELVEIPRLDGISATKVRALIESGRMSEIERLVPQPVYDYCKDNFS